jgi:hypothetical protein
VIACELSWSQDVGRPIPQDVFRCAQGASFEPGIFPVTPNLEAGSHIEQVDGLP